MSTLHETLVDQAVHALEAWYVTCRADAKALLPTWAGYPRMTEQDIRATLDRFEVTR